MVPPGTLGAVARDCDSPRLPLGGARQVRKAAAEPSPPDTRVIRLTDLPGLEESPAISPDGRSVAFTAGVGGTRQLFVQLIAGGAPLQITRDPVDHECPRWSPDSSSILYFSPAVSGTVQGSIWEIPALGGVPRRVVNSVGGADVSPTDGRLALFRLAKEGIQLVTAPTDGSRFDVVAEFAPATYYLYPRWSPDGRWIAFQRGDSIRFDVFVAPATGGEPRQLTRDNNMMSGFAWLPDSTGIVYSSSRGGTMPYLPTLGLWQVTLRDGSVRRVTSGETSYVSPDISRSGAILVGRMKLQTDIWKFPVDGLPAENVRRGVRVTRQTGQVLTPTASPGDKEVAFLSDSGGHANLWVVNTESGGLRQITHERDPNVAMGVPVWSPDGHAIAFVSSRGNQGLTFGVWLVDPDGSNLRNVANPGLGPAWSPDGRWVYYSTRGGAAATAVVLKKVPVDGGPAVTVTTERLRNVIGLDGTTLYYLFERPLVDGTPEFEIRAATPEDAPFRVLARIPASRVPIWQIVNPALSPDGKWLAQALTDGFTTNVWALSTTTGEWRQITDFGERATFIARRVSWSSDGRSILAAVGEGDSDIVLLEGLTNVGREWRSRRRMRLPRAGPSHVHPMLIVLSGLPGTGKTTIARALARELAAVYLRIDSIEQALRDGGLRVGGEGYSVARAVAEDNLRLGRTVIADCVNPWPLTRSAWHDVAERAGVVAIDVELVCSDADEHRRRVEGRTADIDGHRLPTWQEVVERDYRVWEGERLVIDTARLSVDACVRAIFERCRDR